MASLLDETTTTTASTATALSSNLHQAIYMNNMEFFDKLLAEINPETDQKWWYKFDARGKTPLHLAVLLGRREMIMKLMQKGHPVVTCWDKSGWTPIADGISYGDIDTIIKLMEYRNEEISKAVDVTLPKLIENFQDKLGIFLLIIV
jgi:ankyrin repeat protein